MQIQYTQNLTHVHGGNTQSLILVNTNSTACTVHVLYINYILYTLYILHNMYISHIHSNTIISAYSMCNMFDINLQ